MQVASEQQTIVRVILPRPHAFQRQIIESTSKRIMVRAGRRSGKTVMLAIRGVLSFVAGMRVLYAAPTATQTDKYWFEVKRALSPLIDTGLYKLNESENYIERIDTENRIQAKTAWNIDMLRGDYAGLLELDEFQHMDEDVWKVVGAPMLSDKHGDAIISYTPPSLQSGKSQARDPRHAAKLFKVAQKDPAWAAYHFTSHDNPYISKEALGQIVRDMSSQSYRQEILAEDDELQLNWLVYKAFSELCKIDPIPIPKSWLVYVGHDFGGANPAALFSAQDPGTGNFYEFCEYLPGAGRSTAEHVQEFKRITEGYNVLWRSGGSPQEEEIRQGYAAHGWPIMAPRVREVNAQVDKVIGMMELNKIFIFKTCYNRIEELMNCLWRLDESGQPTNKIRDEQKYHLAACARYLYCNFTPETAIPLSGKKTSYIRW